MNARSALILSVFLLFLTHPLFSQAGTLLKSEVTGPNIQGETVTRIDASHLRSDYTENGQLKSVLIHDASKNSLNFFLTDPRLGRVNYEVSEASIAALRKDARFQQLAQRSRAMPDLSKMMANMDPKQRAMIQKMMPPGAGMPARPAGPEYRKAQGSRKILNLTCEMWDLYVLERKAAEICAVQKFAPFEKYEKLVQSGEKIARDWIAGISELSGFSLGMSGMGSTYEAYRKVGYPLQSAYSNPLTGRQERVETLKSTSEQAFGATDFAAPTGYRKVSFADLMAGGNGPGSAGQPGR